jgi:hypothetical protein
MYFLTGPNKAVAISILFLFLFSLAASAQPDFSGRVSFLASDSLHGRAPGTIDEQKANYNFIGTLRPPGHGLFKGPGFFA